MKMNAALSQATRIVLGIFSLFLTTPACAVSDVLPGSGGGSQIMVALVGILITFIIVLLIVLKIVLTRAKRRSEHQQQVLNATQEQLDGASVGILYLDDSGIIQYANRTGGYLLALHPQKLIGTSLLQMMPEERHQEIQTILAGNREKSIQCMLPSSHRHYRIRIAPQLPEKSVHGAMIVLEDVHTFQQQLDAQAAMHEHMRALIEQAELGLATIDLANEQVQFNSRLAQWLNTDAHTRHGLQALQEGINELDIKAFERALEELNKGEPLVLTGSLQKGTQSIPVKIHGMVANHTLESAAPLAHMLVSDVSKEVDLTAQRDALTKKYASLTSSSSDAVYLVDQNSLLSECNRQFCALFEIDSMRARGKQIFNLPCFDETLNKLHQDINKQVTKAQTLTVTLPNGSERTLQVKLQALMLNNQRYGTLGVIADMTEQTRLQREAEDARLRLSRFMDNAPMGIALFDGDDKITEVNDTLSRQLGMSREEFTSHDFYHLFSEASQASKVAKKLQRQDKLNEYTALLKRSDNKPYSGNLYASKISETPQEFVCWVGGREEQDYLNRRFERIMKYTSVPMALLAEEGFTHLNSAACAFFGIMDEDDLLNKQPTDHALNPDNQATQMLADKLDAVRRHGQVVTLNWQHQVKGAPLPCEATFIPVHRDGELQGIICMWVDLRAVEQANEARLEAIRLRDAAEKEIKEKQELLASSQSQLAHKARTLADTEQRLQVAEDDLSEKLTTISHLQQTNEDISAHLASLQGDYQRNRELLEQSQQVNTELETQLKKSSQKVTHLESQRNQIADALQYSEKQYKQAQTQLQESKKETQRLKEAKSAQEKELNAFVAQVDTLKQSIGEKDKQLGEVSGQISSLQSQLTSSSEVSEKLRTQLLNQRKASEVAEKQRRELELACKRAEAELSGKGRRIEHLQHEMQMLEQMSQQEKGDMEKHAKQLQQELECKQAQLKSTEEALKETQRQSEKEKQEKAAQQEKLAQLQTEMAEVENRAVEQQKKIAEADAYWQAQQKELQQELEAKHKQLQQTETFLNDAKQQTAAEKAEKARQQAIFIQLKEELSEMERRAQEQKQQMSNSDEKWQTQQQALAKELEAKQAKLSETKAQLDAHQKQVDAEKLARLEQQNKLEQLKAELSDVAQRANKQQEMMAGSDEQWRKHHQEIEAQKQQLQAALKEAQQQNSNMKSQLDDSMQELASAEEKVSQTQSEEQKLQEELNSSRLQADKLKQRLNEHEQKEAQLQQQVVSQQEALKQNEANMDAMKRDQQALAAKLKSVQQEYNESKKSLSTQNSNQSELTEQLTALEQKLKSSKAQLDSKEQALQNAQDKLKDSEKKLANQEKALVDAQKAELQQAQETTTNVQPEPDFASLPLPPEPNVWFDLLPYLQKNKQVGSMASSLTCLMNNLDQAIKATDDAVMADDRRKILSTTRSLNAIASTLHSEPLQDMVVRLEADCEHGSVDNISIFWPTAKQNLQRSLRVIYSHLND